MKHFYDAHVLPRVIDLVCGLPTFERGRQGLLPEASGRVLAPGGRLLFLEHGAAPDRTVRRWQDRITPYWKTIAGGCHLNREMPALLEAAGFRIGRLTQGYHPGPRLLTYLSTGVASKD